MAATLWGSRWDLRTTTQRCLESIRQSGTRAGVGRFGLHMAKQQGKYNARYPTLADRYPNSDHYPAMAFWRASLI